MTTNGFDLDLEREEDELLARMTPVRTNEEKSAPPDLDRLIHRLQLELASVASQLANKSQHDRDQITTLAKTIGKFVGDQLKPLKDEIAKLKVEVEELRAGGFKYAGVYQRAVGYSRGTVVTFDGALFCAVTDVAPAQAPATCDAWQLCMRREARQPTRGGARPPQTVERR